MEINGKEYQAHKISEEDTNFIQKPTIDPIIILALIP